jgi:hypothetical protein
MQGKHLAGSSHVFSCRSAISSGSGLPKASCIAVATDLHHTDGLGLTPIKFNHRLSTYSAVKHISMPPGGFSAC